MTYIGRLAGLSLAQNLHVRAFMTSHGTRTPAPRTPVPRSSRRTRAKSTIRLRRGPSLDANTGWIDDLRLKPQRSELPQGPELAWIDDLHLAWSARSPLALSA